MLCINRPNGPAIIKSYNELKAKNINYFTEEQRIAYYSEKETPKNYFYKREAITEEFSFDKIIPYQYGSYRNPKLSQSAKSYLGDLQELFNELPSGTEIPVSLGDGMIKKRELGFTKARKVGSNNTILLKLNKRRHWNYDIGADIAWENKDAAIVWRGASTGGTERFNFVNKYKDTHNIGYSNLTPKELNNPEKYKGLLKERMSIEEQLQYKFIVSLEGNDVATNLKWFLHSNSVPIMKKPKCESWLMEGLLKPYTHYLPLDDDFGNLDEILNWAKNNDNICKEIALNGKEYMKMFTDHSRELRIQKS